MDWDYQIIDLKPNQPSTKLFINQAKSHNCYNALLWLVLLNENVMEDYWKKENPKYIDLKLNIESIENRINSGIITNSKTLSLRKRDLKRLKKELSETTKFLIETKKEKLNCLCCNTESKVLSDNGLIYECLNCGDWEYSSS